MIYIKYFTLDIVRIRIYPDWRLYDFRNILTDLNENRIDVTSTHQQPSIEVF